LRAFFVKKEYMSKIKFIDQVKLELTSGSGGPGCISFRKESKVPRGGPNGGDGGRGGHVVFKVNEQKKSLLDLKFNKKLRAKNGNPGESNNCSGKHGDDLIIEVPPGTLVIDEYSDEVILDCKIGEEYQILTGGMGGKGNTFYKSSVHQAPEIAQKGMPGEQTNVRLELKLIADVGLVGFPNAVSAAKPEIANYPFTTLNPHLGVVKVGESDSYVIADIPGLIPGAHTGAGLGLEFLRHIERTRFFVHLLDGDPNNGRDLFEDFRQINEELKKYDELYGGKYGLETLSSKPQIVVINKWDLRAEDEREIFLQTVREKIGQDIIPISGYTGYGLDDLKSLMSKLVFKQGEI
jgi:GTP-binding protein